MSTSPIQSAPGVQGLAEPLTKQFDTDGNGQLTAAGLSKALPELLSAPPRWSSVVNPPTCCSRARG